MSSSDGEDSYNPKKLARIVKEVELEAVVAGHAHATDKAQCRSRE